MHDQRMRLVTPDQIVFGLNISMPVGGMDYGTAEESDSGSFSVSLELHGSVA